MLNTIKAAFKIERGIIYSLLILMAIVLVLATIELAYFVITSIINYDGFFLSLDGLLDLFGVFLLVLIGIELLDTIKVYLRSRVVHVEVVVLVGIIALARKVVVMKVESLTGAQLLGIAALILSLAIAYYLIKKTGLMVCDLGDPEDLKKALKKTIQEDINLILPKETINSIRKDAEEIVRNKAIEDNNYISDTSPCKTDD